MRIAMTADHAGFEMKDQLADWLRADGHDIVDLGTNGPESVDYPRYGAILADALAYASESPFPDVRELDTDVYA